MENLLLLLNKISEVSPLGVFNQEVIVVQNPGMQHWLNLAIAKERGISMNMCYALPAQYLWKLIRSLASDEKVPDQSPYSREVLTWRICALLASKEVVLDSDFALATRYWLKNPSFESTDLTSQRSYSSKENLKRYQLAVQMADLFEQYLIFRPEWLNAWQNGEPLPLASKDTIWQGKLWKLLIQQLPYNPVELLQDAIANIERKQVADSSILPKRLSFFGINSMAPMWLTFINALSEHIEVDFFHLNPSFSYWGDIISEKQAFRKLSHWSGEIDNEHLFVGNPLLANLGQQGREFLALLQEYSTVNVDLFVKASDKSASNATNGSEQPHAKEFILHKLQNDILELNDATKNPVKVIDESITIVSCHSAIREVQALHDYLLHQFNHSVSNKLNNEDILTPKDVLVMCPQIEQYAPYVNAVFTRGWQDLNDEVPPLPCSIADRSAKDSDPLIAAFSELLTLPDSRFQVTQLLSFLRLPAVAFKFSINEEDSDKISHWLEQATIHWGLDKAHKSKILGENATSNFTWQQGLSRLLRGFSFSDNDTIYQDQLLLSTIEGDDAILLGQLMLFVEQLQDFSMQLNQPRTASDWQVFLLNQLTLLFATNSFISTNSPSSNKQQILNIQINNQIENSLAMIEQAISALVEYCSHAFYEEEIDLAIVIDFLNNHFSQGDASRQFMVGQVTFCSMLPMRSIPFKIIAVLGLNDGEFPRQRQPLGFDLMSQSPPRLGDRSRRGDDRYLFLEAIISARKSLYLSYQGRNIKNNTEKQPSLVLKELMDYLSQGYGWHFNSTEEGNSDSETNQLKQLPMQPFSQKNYSAVNDDIDIVYASFDTNWLKLAKKTEAANKDANVEKPSLVFIDESIDIESITANEIIRFFNHPSKVFAQQALNLYLDNTEINLDDVEPFSADYLESYLLKQDLLTGYMEVDELSSQQFTIEQIIHTAELSGKFPDLPNMNDQFTTWLDETKQFSEVITTYGGQNPAIVDCQIVLKNPHDSNESNEIILTAKMPVKHTNHGTQLVFYRSSSAKGKDLFTLYLHQLIVQLWQKQNIASIDYQSNPLSKVESSCGFYFNTKSQKVEQYQVTGIIDEQAQLIKLVNLFQQGQQQPLLLNLELAAQAYKKSRGKAVPLTQDRFEQFWYGNDSAHGFVDDPYISYFWPQCPYIEDYILKISSAFDGLFHNVCPVTTKASRIKKEALS